MDFQGCSPVFPCRSPVSPVAHLYSETQENCSWTGSVDPGQRILGGFPRKQAGVPRLGRWNSGAEVPRTAPLSALMAVEPLQCGSEFDVLFNPFRLKIPWHSSGYHIGQQGVCARARMFRKPFGNWVQNRKCMCIFPGSASMAFIRFSKPPKDYNVLL